MDYAHCAVWGPGRGSCSRPGVTANDTIRQCNTSAAKHKGAVMEPLERRKVARLRLSGRESFLTVGGKVDVATIILYATVSAHMLSVLSVCCEDQRKR